MKNRMTTRRVFTRAEDEMILANSRGLISLHRLINDMRCSSETLERRAGELSVKLVKKPRGSRPRRERHRSFDPTEPSYASDGSNNSPHVGNDLLLKRLRKHHGGELMEVIEPTEGIKMKHFYRIVGMKYRDAELFVREQMKNGPIAVMLEREPENQHDANAVKVILQDRHIGYVRRDQAIGLAIQMDKNNIVGPARRSATLIDDCGYPAAEVTIEPIPTEEKYP